MENPPLLVVCDLDRFEIHTNFTGTVKRVHAFNLSGLAEPANLDILRRVFTAPESLRPGQTTEGVTRQAAELVGQIADGMRVRGVKAHDAAHFLMKLMFSMFAEDIALLPNKIFAGILKSAKDNPAVLAQRMKALFEAMTTGGYFGADEVLHFNGGLFADAEVIELKPDEIRKLVDVNALDWSDVEPSIFGTLFERMLDPGKRSQIGAHYTSRADIETLLEPVVMQPLRREWAAVKAQCDDLWAKVQETSRKQPAKRGRGRVAAPKQSPAGKKLEKLLRDFAHRLEDVTILDPACGSGNFLYVALHLQLDLNKEVISYASQRGITLFPSVRPTQLFGIEINEYAQELASVVIWIGYLQWMHDNGFTPQLDPVLEPFESIRRMDAILDLSDPEHPKEPEWPKADFIVGNPPFLGDKLMRSALSDDYVVKVRSLYKERLPAQSDLCCYWFEKARDAIERGRVSRAGLLATQGIRGGNNRRSLERIKETGEIFFAIPDRDWILDGATVHVSLVGFDNGTETNRILIDRPVSTIEANLTAGSKGGSVTASRPLKQNVDKCYLGVMKAGAFDITEAEALEMLRAPNVHGLPSSNVLRPRVTARDLLQRLPLGWIIDFGCEMTDTEASKFEAPWHHVSLHVKAERLKNRRKRMAKEWWIHGEPRPGMRAALNGLVRFIITPEVSKHRVFAWLDDVYLPDHQTRVFASSDDYFFGVLHSRAHETWARAQGTQLRERESGFRYTPTSCFETFPFPEPTDAQREVIAAAAKELDTLRNNWLNPPEWTRTEVLEFPGSTDGPWRRYIDPTSISPRPRGEGLGEGVGIGAVRYPRLVPKDEDCAKHLARRTLTNLYNERPTWLALAHRRLDQAVFAAYGWPADLSEDQLLERLLELNLSREAAK